MKYCFSKITGILLALVQCFSIAGCSIPYNVQLQERTSVVFDAPVEQVIQKPADRENPDNLPENPQAEIQMSAYQKKKIEYWPTNGWKETSPEDQGMDSSKLFKLKEHIKKNKTGIHSLLVTRNGYLVFEEYYNGYTRNKKNSLQSVTKSIVSALTGIAIREGYLESVDQRVEDIFPEYFTDDTDKSKKDIKIEHLLTMSAGFKWQQNGGTRSQWLNSKDRNKYLISLPLETEPGEKFNYSSGLAHLMSGIITRSAGMSTVKFADKFLFNILGITNRQWDSDSQGYCLGNSGLYLTPRDMAKIGYLFLNNGLWENKQVIPVTWVSESTEKHIGIGSDYADYGYYWWVKTIGSHNSYFALGYGGQYIFVIPDLNIVVVITSRWDKEEMEPDFFMNIVNTYVIESVISNKCANTLEQNCP